MFMIIAPTGTRGEGRKRAFHSMGDPDYPMNAGLSTERGPFLAAVLALQPTNQLRESLECAQRSVEGREDARGTRRQGRKWREMKTSRRAKAR